MTIENTVTYTSGANPRVENTVRIALSRGLTFRGAERIIRKRTGDKTAIVVRVEKAVAQ